MNSVSYTLTFEAQSGTATIVNLPWQLPQYFLTHEPDFSGGEFSLLYQMSFWYDEDAILDLSGKTFDIAEFLSSPPDPIQRVSWDVSDPFIQNPSGHLTFGSGDSIIDWYIHTHDNTGSGESDAHWSQPKNALDSALTNLKIRASLTAGTSTEMLSATEMTTSTTSIRDGGKCQSGGFPPHRLTRTLATSSPPDPVPPPGSCDPSGDIPARL